MSDNNVPTILWGCSVDKQYFDEQTIKDLKRYDYITARESISVENLNDIGIIDNVIKCADPAFTLELQETDVKSGFFENSEVVGINVSDFMKYYNSYNNATLNNFYKLIQYILDNTQYKILIVPHVRSANNDDLIPSLELKKAFNNPRVDVVNEDLNCLQLKYLISKCKAFIGCRTHSTIAAYSTCIPTLVVGYSVKAIGICKDIFDTTDHLLVDARDFHDNNDLTRCFQAFMDRYSELRSHLENTMQSYIQKAYNPLETIARLNCGNKY